MCLLKLRSKSPSLSSVTKQKTYPIYSFREPTSKEDYYRLSLNVSEKDWGDFPGQVTDAITFLERFGISLEKTFREHQICGALLDFPIWSRLDDQIANQNDHIPAELIRICGNLGIGIEMGIYARDAFRSVKPETRK